MTNQTDWQAALVPPSWSRRSWLVAALFGAVVGLVGAVADPAPNRGAVAVLLAFAVTLPFAILSLVEHRVWRQALHLRIGQLEALRLEREWRSLGDWEVCDRLGLLLCTQGLTVEWMPKFSAAGEPPFHLRGRDADGGQMAAWVERGGPISASQLERLVGRACLQGVDLLLLVMLDGLEADAAEALTSEPQTPRIETWNMAELLVRSRAAANLS